MIKKLLRLCAWCPDNPGRTAAALAAGQQVTHGICPACYAIEMRQLREIAPDPVPPRPPLRIVSRLRHRAQLSPV